VTNIKGNDETDFSKFIKRPPWNKYVQAELCACVLHPIFFENDQFRDTWNDVVTSRLLHCISILRFQVPY